jgi:hypothetical protein
MTQPLPALMDNKAIRTELGVTEAAAEAMMRQLDIVTPRGVRKRYVRRADLERYLTESTARKSA